MPVIVGRIIPGPAVSPHSGRLGTTGGAHPVVGHDGQPAVGREVLVLGRDQYGVWGVVAATLTDAAGHYEVSVSAGPNDRFVVVVIGDPGHAEHTRCLGHLEAV